MTATYDQELLRDIDKVRRLLGDTDISNALLSDEEITGLISLMGNVFLAAAMAADGIAGRYSRSASFSVEGLSISNSQKSDNYRKLAANLRAQATMAPGGIGVPFVGGVSIGEMQSVDQDTDREPSRFKVGQGDYPGTTPATDPLTDPNA